MTITSVSKSPKVDDSSSGRSEINSPLELPTLENGNGVNGVNGANGTMLPPYNGIKLSPVGDVPNFNVIPPLPLIYYNHLPLPCPQTNVQLLPLPRHGIPILPQAHPGPMPPLAQQQPVQQQQQPVQHLTVPPTLPHVTHTLPHVQYDMQPNMPPPPPMDSSHLHPQALPAPELQEPQDPHLHPDTYYPNKKKIKKNSRRKHRNSHLGCGTCKKRRIKCDETLPACHNCLKGKLHCAYLNLDSNAQAALRMAQYNQLLRQEKIENSMQPHDKSTSTSPKPTSPNPITSPKQMFAPYQSYPIPQIMPPQPMLAAMPMNQQIPPPLPIQHPLTQGQQQHTAMIYAPPNSNVQPFAPMQHPQNFDHQHHDQDVKLPPIKKLTNDLDKVPKISNLLM